MSNDPEMDGILAAIASIINDDTTVYDAEFEEDNLDESELHGGKVLNRGLGDLMREKHGAKEGDRKLASAAEDFPETLKPYPDNLYPENRPDKPASEHPLEAVASRADDYGADPDYDYRVSDLSKILPEKLWVSASFFGMFIPSPGDSWRANQNAANATMRLHYCEQAREVHGISSPRLKVAIIKEREAVDAFRNLEKYYLFRKGIIEK